MPSKFAYTGEFADTWLNLQALKIYKPVSQTAWKEANLIAKQVGLQGIPLVYVGVGNGEHSEALIRELQALGIQIDKCSGADFSGVLLDYWGERLPKAFPDLKFDSFRWDIAGGPTDLIRNREGERPAAVALLGQTLGNNKDPQKVLENLHASARPGDILVVGVALGKDGQTPGGYLEPYLVAGDVFAEASVSPMRPSGAEKDITKFVLRFDEGTQTVVGSLRFKEPATLRFKDDSLHFNKGDEVVVFTSHRFREDEMIKLLEGSGWTFLDAASDEDETNGVFTAIR